MESYKIPFDAYSVGRSIDLLDRCQHWGNVDSDEAVYWAGQLPNIGPRGEKPLRHTLGSTRNFDVDWDIDGEIPWDTDEIMWHGSTALFAIFTCFAMNYKKIALAGCPMDAKGHWYWKEGNQAWTGHSYIAWFEFAATPLAKRVRSFSGYTAQLLGKPNKKWLECS